MSTSAGTSQGRLPGVDWSLEDLVEYIESCFDRDTILDILMGYSAHWFTRRMTLIVGRGWVQLFGTDGFELPAEIPKAIRRADIDDSAPALNDEVATGTPQDLGVGTLFEQLELDEPLVRTIAVSIGSRVAVILVGTIDDESTSTASLKHAARLVSKQLESVIRMAKDGTLPPPEERTPPFPEPSEASQASEVSEVSEVSEASESGDEDPGRSVYDEKTRVNDAPSLETRKVEQLSAPSDPSETMNSPSLGAMTSDDSEPKPEVEPSEAGEEELTDNAATSFGLPFSVDGKSDVELGSSPEESQPEESQPEESEPEAIIGSPFVDDRFPGSITDESSAASEPKVDDDPERDALGNEESTKTQLGGLSAQKNLIEREREAAEKNGGPGTVMGSPNTVGDGSSSDFVDRQARPQEHETHTPFNPSEENARSTAEVDRVPDEAIESHAKSKDWKSARDDAGVPAAMILKPARKRGRKRTKSSMPAGTRSGENEKAPKQRPKRTERPTPVRQEKPTPSSPNRSGGRATRSSSIRGDDSAFPTEDTATKPTEKATAAGFSREDNKTRRFDDDDVDDAWFDYFADSSEDNSSSDKHPEEGFERAFERSTGKQSQVSETSDPIGFSLDEPDFDLELNEVGAEPSLPPETLERLLDSGPQMVDMQEQFLILDSRDRDKAFQAAEQVADLGDMAVEILDMMFPGRVFLDRYQFADELPPVNEHGPVLNALVRIGDQAVEIARKYMRDSSNETRFYAVFLLTRLNAEPALGDLFDRLFDRDLQIRKTAADIALDYHGTDAFDANIRRPLRSELLSPEDLHVTVAAKLLGRLKDIDAVVPLIDSLEDTKTSRVKQALVKALIEITLHSWSSPYEWRKWWREARGEDRRDWLIDAMDSQSSDLRFIAYDEVQRFPGLDLNYHPDQPPKLRRRAQDDLREWLAGADD